MCACLWINMLRGPLREFYWWGEWAQRLRPLPTQERFGMSPNFSKDFYTTNIHYFVYFIFIKWKLYATNTFERLGESSRITGVSTCTGPGHRPLPLVPRCCFRWDTLGARAYKLKQRSRYFNASCTNHLYIHRPSFLQITFVFYLKPVLHFSKMPPPRKLPVCLTHL